MRDVCVYIYTAQLTDWLANHANAPGTSGASLSLSFGYLSRGFFFISVSHAARERARGSSSRENERTL